VNGPEIRVSPGLAVNPKGAEICVPQTMCARLNAWIASHRTALESIGFTVPGTLPLSVVLCHRQCFTDIVPVAGEPCRKQEDATAPSRIQDSFELKLVWNSASPIGPSIPGPSIPGPLGLPVELGGLPESVERQGIDRLGIVLRRIRVDAAAPVVTDAQIADAVRAVGAPGDPQPPSVPAILLSPNQAPALLRTLFKVWVTEVRPRWVSADGSACADPNETCVLLGDLEIPIGALWAVNGPASGVVIQDSHRPLLLSTQVLQELAGIGVQV
jgi:hypothetical protein